MKMLLVLLLTVFVVSGCQSTGPQAEKTTGQMSAAQLEPVATRNCERILQKVARCLRWSWVIKPAVNQPGQLEFALVPLTDKEPKNLQSLALKVDFLLWMPSMDHGSTPVSINAVGEHHYMVSDIGFVMPGVWQLQFNLMNGNKVYDQVVIPYEVRTQ